MKRGWTGRAARRLHLKGIAIGLGVFVGLALVGAGIFHVACQGPAEAVLTPPDTAELQAKYVDYKRTEESTYLTLLEWYQVFSYQEYGQAIERDAPSRFPYFGGVTQSWGMYCHAYGYTEETYPFNGGNHLMLGVIGVSFAGEYAAKGFYENTIGWLAEWDSYDTGEDAYAADVAQDYGEFVETEPWYAYPFASKTSGVWTDPVPSGHPVRSLERKTYLTAEYGIKAGYAFLIRQATGAIYGAPPALDYLWLTNATSQALATPGVKVVEDRGGGEYVITVPHYQGFTDAVPILARHGVRFHDISGNAVIVATLIAPGGWSYNLPVGEQLFSQPVLTSTEQRIVVRIPVAELDRMVRAAADAGIRVEHLFDY